MSQESLDRLERMLLLHLLEHRGQQVRFEASQWTTEFGILRKFSVEDSLELKQALRSLEMMRMVYRRTQYVVGYSEPKHVYSLTAVGHRKALVFRRGDELSAPDASVSAEPATSEAGASSPSPSGGSASQA